MPLCTTPTSGLIAVLLTASSPSFSLLSFGIHAWFTVSLTGSTCYKSTSAQVVHLEESCSLVLAGGPSCEQGKRSSWKLLPAPNGEVGIPLGLNLNALPWTYAAGAKIWMLCMLPLIPRWIVKNPAGRGNSGSTCRASRFRC